MLSNLLKEFNELCVEQRVNNFINNIHTLKHNLVDKEEEEELGFYSVSRCVIVFSTDVNPCEYSVATLKGNGLQDFDIIKSFSNLIKRKIVDKESTFENFRYDANSLLENIEQYKPQRELYNIIYSTIHGTWEYQLMQQLAIMMEIKKLLLEKERVMIQT